MAGAYYQRNRAAILRKMKVRAAELKAACISHYSGGVNRCACCGEAERAFLTLDHVGGGARNRRQRLAGKKWPLAGTTFYARLRKLGFPSVPPLQVLCFNCGFGRRVNGGLCPHQPRPRPRSL